MNGRKKWQKRASTLEGLMGHMDVAFSGPGIWQLQPFPQREPMIYRFLMSSCLWIICLGLAGCNRGQSTQGIRMGDRATTEISTSKPSHSIAAVSHVPARVIESAKQCIVGALSPDQIELTPASVVESDNKWQVFFKFKEKHEERNGKRVIVKQLPEFIRVDVQKSDLSAIIVPGR